MEESVYVEYPSARKVFVDGTLFANTGEVFNVETGTHTFDLGKPNDYMPSAITKQVTGTTPLGPCIVHFDPKVSIAPKAGIDPKAGIAPKGGK